MTWRPTRWIATCLLFAGGCTDPRPLTKPTYVLAVHGGAGGIPRDTTPQKRRDYVQGLSDALALGRDRLAAGGASLDVVEAVVAFLEDHPSFNAGKGAVFNATGEHELDASIMDGQSLRAGAVAGVRNVKNPIRLARRVMDETRFILLGGEGAEQFAQKQGFEPVPNKYFSTPRRREAWEQWKTEKEHGTVGAVALDLRGNLAAATSTGGLTGKLPGRIGDSPIIGAGTYASNQSCAISGTGVGEEFIRYNVARSICALMEHRDLSLEAAARRLVFDTLREGEGGIIGVARDGSRVGLYNTKAMFRGFADARGRFEVAIWDEPETLEAPPPN